MHSNCPAGNSNARLESRLRSTAPQPDAVTLRGPSTLLTESVPCVGLARLHTSSMAAVPDIRKVVAALRRLPPLANVDEQSLLLPQWSTLETVFLHLFRLNPQLSDISTFIQQRQHDRTLERLHPTPASLALARDREALYRQLVVELVYGQLYGVKDGKRMAAKATGGSLLGEKGEGVRVVAELVRLVMGAAEEEKVKNEDEEVEEQAKPRRAEMEDEKKAARDERKYADDSNTDGSARKRGTAATHTSPDRYDRRPSTAAVGAEKRSADKSKSNKSVQPVPAPRSAAARQRAEEEKEREMREERERQRRQEREEEEKMVEMREMMRQKALKEARRSEHTLRNKPPPASPSSDVDVDDTDTTAARRPLTAAVRQPSAARGKVGATTSSGSAEVVMLERQLREERDKVAALERRVREMESIITGGSTKAVGEDSWRQQLLLHAQCEQWRRQCTLLQSVVDGKRQVMDELRTVCEWMREGGRRLRRLEKGSGNGEEEGRRLVSGMTAMVSEMMVAADAAMKRIESLDQHTNSLSTSASTAASTTASSTADSSLSLPAVVLLTLASFASHLRSAHPQLVELQQTAHIMHLDRAADTHDRKGGKRAADAAEQLAVLADESRKLSQLLIPHCPLAHSALAGDTSTPLSSSLSSSLSSTTLSSTERRQLLTVVSEAERTYTSDLRTYSTHLSSLYPLLSSLLSSSSSLLTSISPLLRQLSSLSSASTGLASAATASSASKRIAEVMRLVSERADEWAGMERDIRRVQDEMSRLMAEGKKRLVHELWDGEKHRRDKEEDVPNVDERGEVEDDTRWQKTSRSAVEHHQQPASNGRPRNGNGKVRHEQEWQA